MESNPLSHLAYSISSREQEGDFFFITDSGAQHSIYFTDGDGYAPNVSFAQHIKMVGFQPIGLGAQTAHVGYDPRIMPTIIEVLYRLLYTRPDVVLVYVCSNEGGLQQQRSYLFARWFRKWQQVGNVAIEKIDYSLYQQLYRSCLFRSGHPSEVEIRQTIERLIQDKQ